MNKKNGLICLFVLVILFQIAVPIGFIAYRNSLAERNTEQEILEKGTDYKFRVRILYISQGSIHYAFRYTQPRVDAEQKEYLYAKIDTDEYGYSTFHTTNHREKDAAYIRLNYNERKEFPYISDNLPTDNPIAYTVPEEDVYQNHVLNTKFYLLVRIYKGRPLTIGMFTEDGRPVEEWLNENEAILHNLQSEYDRGREEYYKQQKAYQEQQQVEANNLF